MLAWILTFSCFRFGRKGSFFNFPTGRWDFRWNGFNLNQPEDFLDPNRNSVLDVRLWWSGSTKCDEFLVWIAWFWHQTLVAEGIIVCLFDNRGTGLEVEISKACYFLCESLELWKQSSDEGGKILGQTSIYRPCPEWEFWGWSYGGYMFLTGFDERERRSFKTAIAVAFRWQLGDITIRFIRSAICNSQLNPADTMTIARSCMWINSGNFPANPWYEMNNVHFSEFL